MTTGQSGWEKFGRGVTSDLRFALGGLMHQISNFKLQTTTVLLTLAVFASPARSAEPNIVFILLDDLGWRDFGCYGSTFYETPNIDRLAAQSTRFTNAYAACPVCSP